MDQPAKGTILPVIKVEEEERRKKKIFFF